MTSSKGPCSIAMLVYRSVTKMVVSMINSFLFVHVLSSLHWFPAFLPSSSSSSSSWSASPSNSWRVGGWWLTNACETPSSAKLALRFSCQHRFWSTNPNQKTEIERIASRIWNLIIRNKTSKLQISQLKAFFFEIPTTSLKTNPRKIGWKFEMDPLRTLDFQARWVVSRGGGSYLNGSPPWRSGPMWYCEGGTTSQGGPGRSKRHIFFNGNCLFQFENVGGDSPFSEELLRLLGLPILYLHWMEGFQISKMFFIILYSFYKNHKILRTYIWSQDADSLLARHQQEMMTFFLDWGNPYSINLYFATGILEGGGGRSKISHPFGRCEISKFTEWK